MDRFHRICRSTLAPRAHAYPSSVSVPNFSICTAEASTTSKSAALLYTTPPTPSTIIRLCFPTWLLSHLLPSFWPPRSHKGQPPAFSWPPGPISLIPASITHPPPSNHPSPPSFQTSPPKWVNPIQMCTTDG